MIQKCTSFFVRQLAGNRAAGLKISKQNKYFRELRKFQWKSEDENIKVQKKRLYDIVCFAVKEVPYYKELGLKPEFFSIENIYDDIRKIPILTKDIIRKQGNKMYPINRPKDWSFQSTSGGTTGEPIKFRHSGVFFDYDQAGKMLFDEWASRKPGESQIRLWGSERDIISGKKDWLNKIYRWCRNEMFINTFCMTENDMDECIKKINRKKPKMILAYVQSIRELAKYIEYKSIKIYKPEAIMTSAGTLDNTTYELVKRVFDCPILNRYGSREIGDMACSCNKNEGLHMNLLTSYLEVLDSNGNPCKKSEVGNIVVTSIMDYSMPIIRYEIGDRGAIGENVCSCGRGWPMLQSVNGRIIDFFQSKSGTQVYGDYFTHLFYTQDNVKQFQVIQDTLTHITIKLVFYDKDNVTQEFYTELESNVRKVLGEEIEFSYEYLDFIPTEKSGKRAYTICLLNQK